MRFEPAMAPRCAALSSGKPYVHDGSMRCAVDASMSTGGLALAGSPVEAGAIELRLFFGELGEAFGSGFFP